MSDLNRRDFLRMGFVAGTAVALIPGFAKGNSLFSEYPDISVVTGDNYFANTIKSVEQLGGIGKFATKDSKVGLLVNFTGQWTRPGTFVNPEIVLAVLKMLDDAGIKDITYLVSHMKDYYEKSPKSSQFENIIKNVKNNSGEFIETEIPKGIALKKAFIIKDLFDCDVFINIAISKHHSGTMFTNCLKNYMGACKHETNKFFHTGTTLKEGEQDTEHMAQCIADVNLVRKPDLCISDATFVLKTNGPFGPGVMIKPRKVFAGANPVEMDSYGCTLLDFRPEDIRTIVLASENGIGQMDLKKMNIKETTL
jgi:uncharacterized protein (DUF362 family)